MDQTCPSPEVWSSDLVNQNCIFHALLFTWTIEPDFCFGRTMVCVKHWTKVSEHWVRWFEFYWTIFLPRLLTVVHTFLSHRTDFSRSWLTTKLTMHRSPFIAFIPFQSNFSVRSPSVLVIQCLCLLKSFNWVTSCQVVSGSSNMDSFAVLSHHRSMIMFMYEACEKREVQVAFW